MKVLFFKVNLVIEVVFFLSFLGDREVRLRELGERFFFGISLFYFLSLFFLLSKYLYIESGNIMVLIVYLILFF